MARAATTTDAFSAIAEPRRREVLGALAFSGERDVTWLAGKLGWPQPVVSKHLGVLLRVGLVSVVRRGRHRVYRVNGRGLRPVYEWAKMYERFWTQQLDRIKDRAERMEREAREKSPKKS